MLSGFCNATAYHVREGGTDQRTRTFSHSMHMLLSRATKDGIEQVPTYIMDVHGQRRSSRVIMSFLNWRSRFSAETRHSARQWPRSKNNQTWHARRKTRQETVASSVSAWTSAYEHSPRVEGCNVFRAVCVCRNKKVCLMDEKDCILQGWRVPRPRTTESPPVHGKRQLLQSHVGAWVLAANPSTALRRSTSQREHLRPPDNDSDLPLVKHKTRWVASQLSFFPFSIYLDTLSLLLRHKSSSSPGPFFSHLRSFTVKHRLTPHSGISSLRLFDHRTELSRQQH